MTALNQLKQAKRIMFLQGPMGSFFSNLIQQLIQQKKQCYKVNFNAGDAFFSRHGQQLHFDDRPEQFEAWLLQHVRRYQIDALVCFGDCRYYHRVARSVAKQLRIQFLVFEEGYIRPDYVTFECEGVNDYSPMNHVAVVPSVPLPEPKPESIHVPFRAVVWIAFVYYLMWFLGRSRYPYYMHHRGLSFLQEFLAGVLLIWRRIKNELKDPPVLQRLVHEKKRFFVVALQVHNDSQIRFHSDYSSIQKFIAEVIESFATQAIDHHVLVFKHHPLDRGYRHYGRLIKELALQYDIAHRVVYVCDVHLPTLLKHALGLVTINSTTGLQALYHGLPVKVMGRAIYHRNGLTSQCSLNAFWQHPEPVDMDEYHNFRSYLIYKTQLNGAFFGHSPWFMRLSQPVEADITTVKPASDIIRFKQQA